MSLFLLKRSVYLDEEFPRRPQSEWRITIIVLLLLACACVAVWLVGQSR